MKLVKLLSLGIVAVAFTANYALAEVQEIVISTVGNEYKYDKTEITAKAGSKVKLVLKNAATTPGIKHNVVIVDKKDNIQKIAIAGITAGEANSYAPNDPAVLAKTGLAEPGKETSVEFTVPAAGDYPFVCTFPGHWAMMQGTLKATS